MAVVLGLDYGSKRIGVARGNTAAKLAAPLLVVPNDGQHFSKLQEIVFQEKAEHLVVGLPRGLDGQETAQTAICREFGQELSKQLLLPVSYQDEALTSRVASSRVSSKKSVDSAAAALILQDYLDSL